MLAKVSGLKSNKYMAAGTEQVRLFAQAELEAIAGRYPEELATDLEGLVGAFEGFQPPRTIPVFMVQDEWDPLLLHATIGKDRPANVGECVVAGLGFVTDNFGKNVEPTHTSFSRRVRLTREYMTGEGFVDYAKRVRELTDDEVEVGKHFFVYGVALGVRIRREIRTSLKPFTPAA